MILRALNSKRRAESGFTLIEALTAICVLSFGLIAISNLMIVSTSSNFVSSQSTAATMLASQRMEELRATPFSKLAYSATDTLIATLPRTKAEFDALDPAWAEVTNVEGVGQFVTSWRV